MFGIRSNSVEYVGLRLSQRAAKTESKVDDQLIPFAIEIGKVLVVIFGVLIILGNIFGIDTFTDIQDR